MSNQDEDVQMEIDEPASGGAGERTGSPTTSTKSGTTHLILGGAFGMKIPPPEYSGIPHKMADKDSELPEVAKMKPEVSQGDSKANIAILAEPAQYSEPKPSKRNKKKKNKAVPEETIRPLIMPLISAPPSIVANPPSRITGPIELDEDDLKEVREQTMGRYQGRRGRGRLPGLLDDRAMMMEDRVGRMDDRGGRMEGRGRMMDDRGDDEGSPGRNGRGNWQRPRHGKYKYPDDFDEEDFEEGFGGGDGDYGNDYDEYGPSRERGPPQDRGRQGQSGRDFGPGPRPFGQRPNFQGPHHGPPGSSGYGPRNFGQEGSYGQDGPGNFGPHGFGQGPMLGAPRGPPPLISPGGPSMGPGGPPMGPGGAMGSGNFPQHGFGPGPGMGHGPPQGQGYREGFQGSPGQGFASPTQGPWQGEGFPPPPPPPQPTHPNFNMPPQQQQSQQTFSGEVFHSEGFNPAFQGMPLPDAVQPTPPVAQESAENLIAMGMNPDLAKILDADSKNRPKTDSATGTPKKKSKKKKKKGESEKPPEPEQSFDVDEVILPMSIPLPDDVPLPQEPKKKKKKKKDKDLENVMFPPLPDVEQMVGPAPKPATPPIPVLQVEHIVAPPPVDRPETMPQLPPEGPPAPTQYKQQSQFLPPERSQLPLPMEQLQSSVPQPMLQTQPAPPIPQAVPQPVQRSIQQSIYDGQPVPAQIFCSVPQNQPVQMAAPVQAQQVSRQIADQVAGHSSLPQGVSAVPPFQQIQSQGQMVPQVAMQGSTTQEVIVQGQVIGIQAPTVSTIQQPVIQNQLGQQVIGQGVTVSQMPPLQSVQQSSVRRSRFDPNWTPDQAVLSMIQQVPMTIHQTTVSPVQLPIMQQSLSHPGPSSSPGFQNTTTAIQQVVPVPSLQQTGVEQQIQQSQVYQSVQPGMPVIGQTIPQQEIPIQNLNMMNQEVVPTAESEEVADSRMSHESVEIISEHVHDTQNEDFTAMETDVTETLPESEEQHLQKSDDNYVYFENKAAQKEEQTAEPQIPKEPVTASQLLEKFKQKRQLKKIDNKSEFTKFPVVLPTPLIQKAGSKEEVKLQDKGQGKFTFAIRKLKQLEAEKEEEEKQVLTALSTEQEQKKEIPVRELIDQDADFEKFKLEKLSREKDTDVKPKSLFKERKKKSKSPEKKSRSRSDSREKKKSKKQKSVSRDRSRSRGRKSKSRERSKSRDTQKKSSPKRKERSLSPWRKDREFFKRYGRFPRPGEADSITYESNSSRDRGRFNERNRGSRISSSRWSPERSREREKSRDRRSRERESRNRKSKDRESRDQRSRERESPERIKDRKDRKRSGERGEQKVNRESEDKENQRSREKKYKDKEGKNNDWKRSRDDSSSENDSSSESESEDDRKKQNKQLVANRRTRSSSTERSRKLSKDRSVSLDKKKSKSKDQTKSENKESENVTIKTEPVEQIEYNDQGKGIRETKSYATVGNLYEGVDATEWNTQREEKHVKEAVHEEAMETNETFETGNDRKWKDKSGGFSDDEAVQKTVKAEKEHRHEERDKDISRIYEEPTRAVSKQYEEDWYKAKDKEKRKDRYKEDIRNDRPEHFREERRPQADRVNEPSDNYRNEKDRQNIIDDDKYRENRDKNIRVERQDRFKEAREDKYRRDVEPGRDRRERKYDRRGDDSDADRDRDRVRKYRDDGSDHEDNYRGVRRDDGRQRRYDDRYSRPEQVEETAAKSKWDSGSESGDDYEKTHIEELPTRSSSSTRPRRDENQASTSMSGTVKLEIDISKINQLKLLNKMMKAKKQRDSVSDQSSDSSDENELKSKKKQKKDKQIKKKTKKDKKKHADSDSENEDSVVKQKKKKKTKKKKKNYGDDSDDDGESQKKEKRKKKHLSSETEDSSADGFKSKKKYKEGKKRKKYESESDNSVTKVRKGKSKRSKERDTRKYESSEEEFIRKKRIVDKQRKTSKYHSESEEERSVRNNRDKQKSARDDYRDFEKKSKDRYSRRELRDQSDDENIYRKENDKQRKKVLAYNERMEENISYSRHRNKSNEKYDEGIRRTNASRKGRKVSEDSASDEDGERHRHIRKPREHKKEPGGSDEEYDRKQGKSKQRRSYESGGSDDRSFGDVMKGVKQYKQNYLHLEQKEPDGSKKKLSKSGSPSERGERIRDASGSNSESDHGCTKRSVRSSKEIKQLPTDMLIAEEKRSVSKEKRNIDDYKSEKVNKRLRSPSSRSKSRSRSRSKILKSEKQKKRYSSESDSGPNERFNREKRKKRTPSTDEEKVPRKYEDDGYRNRNREDAKTYGRDSISPRRTQRYDKDRRSPKTCEGKMVLKERHRREKDDSYDEDYRSRKKREVDKGRSRHSSSDNSSDSSSNSESDSEKDSRKTKSKGQKNAEAGTGFKMGPVPGTPPMTENTDIELQPTATAEVMKDLKEVEKTCELETAKCNPLDRNDKILLPELKLEFDNRHAATSSKEDKIANRPKSDRSDKTLCELSDNGPAGEEHRETSSKKHSKVKDKKDKDKKKHKKKKKKKKKKHLDKNENKDNLNSSTDSYQSSGKKENMQDVTKSENHNKPESTTVVDIANNELEAGNTSGKKNIDEVQNALHSCRTSLLVDYGTDDDTASEGEIAKEIVKEVGSDTPALTPGKDNMAVEPMEVDPNASLAVELPVTLSPTQKSKARISFRLSVDSDLSCSGTREDHIENDKTDDKGIEKNETNDAEKTSSKACSMEKKDETAIETGNVEPNVDVGELYDPFEMLDESSSSDNEVVEKQKAASPKPTEKPTQEAKSSLAVATSPSANSFPNTGLNTSVTSVNMEPIISACQGEQSGTGIESVHSPVPNPIGVQASSTPDISVVMPQNPPGCPSATLTAIVQQVVPVPIGTDTLLLPAVTIPSSGTFQSCPNVGHIMQSTGPPTPVVQAKSPGIISSLPAMPRVDGMNKPAVPQSTLSPQHQSVTGSKAKHVDIQTFIPIERDTALKESKTKTSRVSRWDTDEHLKKEKQAKSKDEDLYDPFASDSDSSPPRSPKMKAQEKKDSAATKDAVTTIVSDMSTKSKPEVEILPSPQATTTSSQTPLISDSSKTTADMSSKIPVISMSSKPDTQSKITMKFMMGRKVIGKSAIITEDGEEKNEETHMPKLKLSTPIENLSNVNVPAPAKMSYIETKRAMEKSMQAAEFIQKELEKSDQMESQEMDYKHRHSERRMERSMSKERKLRSRSRERTRKRSISRDRHSGLSKERRKSGSKERSVSRERKGRFLRNRRGSLSKERKRSTSREKKRSSSRDRKSSSLKDKKGSLSKERRSTSREKIRGKEGSSRVRLRGINTSRERSMSTERRHGSASRERVKKRSTSREKRRVRSDSIERRRARSKSHERRPMSFRDDSFERARKRRLNRDVSPRHRHLEKRSISRSQSPSLKRGQIGARTKKTRHRKQSSTESSSSDSSDSDSSYSSSSDEDEPVEKKHFTKKADLSIKKRKWDKDTTETLEIKREAIVSDSEKMKTTRSDSVDGSTHDLVVENKLNVLDSKAIEKHQPVSAREIDKIHCKEDEQMKEETNTFMQVDEEISFKTPTMMIVSPEETDICTEQADVLNASSPTKYLERSNQFETQSPEKRKVPLGEDLSCATDQENGEERDGDKSLKDALESTPISVSKYSTQTQPPVDISPIVKLFDISPNKSENSSASIMLEGEIKPQSHSTMPDKIHNPSTVDDGDTSEDAMVNRDKKSKETKELVSVAKRLTRRQAAEQNLVLPPVMSKDMPIRGRRGSRQSSDTNSASSSPSIVESTYEKFEDSSNDCTILKKPKSDIDIEKHVEMQSEILCIERGNRSKPVFASNSKSGTTDLNIEDIPMPSASIDENENTVGSKASRNKPKLEEIPSQATAMVDMDLDEPDETLQNIEIIIKDGKQPDLVPIKDIPANIEKEVIQPSELPYKEESFQTDALKGFSLKLLPNAMKKPKQKLTSQMLEDVFDTNLAKPGKPKFRLKLSDEPIKSLSFGPPEFHISPKQTVITTAVASFKPLADEINPTESHDSQTEARIEDLGPVKEKDRASTGEQVKREENITDININEKNGTTNKVEETAKPVENTRKSDYLLTPKSEEAIKAENLLKMPQISPEQIGKAIQVIGQENLRRLEVLQRESAKLLQGKKIEVVGQRVDTTQVTASTSQGIATISDQSLYDNPSSHKPYEDADLGQLEREKQELLNKLHTRNPGFPMTNESQVFHGNVDTIPRSGSGREKDDCGTSPRRDRPDSRRERKDDDYDERRSGRGHRERRKGRDSRSRERSRDRESFRGKNKGRSRDQSSRERDRSRERNRKKRHRDVDRYRSRRRSRSRSWSRDRRSQSRDQRSRDRGSRSRDCRSRSRGRDRRSRSQERRSHSRDRRSRSRERRKGRRSRSRSRDKRSRSRSRDKDRKLKDNNSKKESALEKFEKELAAKKKVLLQPVASSPLPSTVTQPLVTQADQNHQFVDPHGNFAQVDQTSAPHFLPQPFPVHQQMQIPMFPMGQTMPDQQFAGFHPDPSMFQPQPPMGPQFFPEGMPPQMSSAPMQQGPQHFQGPPGPGFHPGMFQPGPGPHPMDANFMPPGHNQTMHMEHYPGHIGPGTGTNLQNDLIPGHPTHHGMGHAPGLLPLPDMGNSQGPPPQPDMEHKPALLPLPDMGSAQVPPPISDMGPGPGPAIQSDLRHASGHHTRNDSRSLILRQGQNERQPGMEIDPVRSIRSRSVPDHQTKRGYNEPEPEEQYDRTPVPDFEIEEEDVLEFKHGFGGPGIPGHPGLKQAANSKESVSGETKELKRRGKRVSRFEPREPESIPIEQPTKMEQPVKMEPCEESTKIDQAAKNDPLAKTEQPTKIEEIQKTDEKPPKSIDHTGFGKWQPVSPGKKVKQLASADTVSDVQFSVVVPQSRHYEITSEDASTDLGLDSTPQNQFEDMSDNDSAAGKPMKVKSRWRRASEAETPPPPPPPSKKYGKQPKEVIKEVKEAKDMEDDEVIPINFDLIDENIHLAERKRSKQMREVRRMVCDCTTCKEDREMGADACGEDCLNRMLFIECGSRCPCGDYCTNKRFQKKQNAKVSPFKTNWKGHGLKALEELEPGQFVMEYVGEVLDYPLFKKRSKQYSKAGQQHFYFMAINPEEIVDATIKGNISRFINHSCDPNCETQKWTVNGSIRVGFFVRKPIKKDEEITFDYKYEVYGKEAQKCFCGTSICRGWLGGDKRMELKSTRRSASVDELEKKKKELFDDSDKLEEEIERMSELHEGLRNKNDVLNMCRLMVRAEDPEHRLQILRVLENTEEAACLRLFLDYHGLPLVWCWMADVKVASSDLKHIMLKVLKKLPITNKTILQDSKILDIVRKWSEAGDGLEPAEGTDALETTQEITDTDNTENDDEVPSTPPVLSNKNPISILAAIGDKKSVKKSVKFAEVESSSDSESRASASESDLPGDSVEGDVTSSSQTGSRVKTRRQLMELRRKLLEKHPMQGELESMSDVTQSTDADSSSENQSESSQREVTPVESEDTEPEIKSVGITEKESEELENIVRAAEIKNLASDLLEHWSSLKELYKIPKKEVLEERKKTERELDSNYEKIALIEERKKKVSGWETVKGRKRKREPSYKEDTDDSDSNSLRKTLLATPPRMSKSERRQLFEAQVKAQDEMAAEYQRHQEQMQQEQYEQYEQEQLIQQQHQRQLMQDPSFWYYATQDPNFLPSIGIDPQQFLQQLAMDPVLLQQLMATIPNFQQQLEHLTFMYQQAVLQASRYEMSGQQEMVPHEETEPMTEEHLAFLQQVEAFKLQHLEPSKTAMAPVEDEDVPPPPSPPKGKAVVLPPNWKTAKDAEGKMYYYHTVTRQTQWDPPNIDTGEHAEDMDLGTPTQDDTTSKAELKEEREKTTTAAADTSSETSRKLKEQFKTKMSSWIVVCLNPFRKPDCKLGRVASTEDFKHLARKLTHHVMAKELKHCRHVEDLEVNENVKSKAKDFVKKYMTKFGASYKRSGNSPSYE